MKRLFILLIACFCFINAHAAYLRNIPVTVNQPDGTVLHCYASGDEYFNYLHDANGYTIMQHPHTGFYVYADKRNGELVATEFVAGRVDPASKNLMPFNLISPEEWMARRNAWQAYDNPVVHRSGLPNHGTLNNISIFIRFSDDSEFTNSYSDIDNMFNNVSENAVSMRSYFRAASYGSIEIPTTFYPGHNGNVIISYQDTNPRSYFQPYNESTNTNGYQDDNERTEREFGLLERAVNYINANYPIPTSLNIDYDNDGYVDNVCFIVRGGVGAWSSLLWPHMWSLYGKSVYINGKRVWTFNFQLADAAGYFNTSTMCHEMNHSLGAPDLYHYSYTGPDAVGVWDLMHANATPPQHCGAYMKMKYGHWIDEIPEITQAGTYTLNPISSTTPTNVAYKIQSDNPTQYYVLEYRDNTSLFETALPGSGLLVYRIDTRFSGNADYNPSNGIYDEVYIFRPNGTTSENGNLSSAYFSANVGRTEFSSSTTAYPFYSDGTPDYNFRIYDITSAGSTISFKYGTSSSCEAPTNLVASVEDHNVTLSWDAATNAVSYNIYRNGDLIGNATGTTYSDSNVDYGRYTYFLKSVDANGLLSTPTAPITVTVVPQGAIVIGEGTATSEELPSHSYYKYAFTQQIYTAEELGGEGMITSIAFYNGGAEKTRTYDFYLKSTTKSAFSSTTDWEIVSNADKVFSGSVTMVADGWTLIVLDTPFNYDGTSNVVLVADDNSGEYTSSPHMSCRVFDATSQAIRIYSDNTDYNPFTPTSYTGTIMNVKNQLLLVVGEAPVGYDITVSANPPEGGTVGGAGSYNEGITATVTATANEGYTFVNWTENGAVVSTDATYSFTVEGSRTLVANFMLNSYLVTAAPIPVEGGMVTIGGNCNTDEFFYDFEDGTLQGWTILQGPDSDSPNNWMHCANYNGNVFSSGHGHNASNGFMLSESFIYYDANSGIDVHPDNYLVSPQIQLGGSINFWAAAVDDNYGAEHFAVAVSTNGNTSASDFTTIQEWTLLAERTGGTRNINDGIWYEYTVDLGAYSGLGYVAIHHFNCTDQWMLCIDDITIVEGYIGLCSAIYNHGESCTVTAIANEGYTFVNWTKNGTEVSTGATYNITVTEAIALVANFSMNSYEVTAVPVPIDGGMVTVDGNCNTDQFFYDFEDGTLQGWTLLQGPNGDSPNNWMHCVNYNGNDFSAGYGHNASNGFVLSESFVFASTDDEGTPVHPDNYLVSPQIQLGGSISFWATVVDNHYGAEHLAVAVSTNGNSSVNDFTTVQEWTMSAKRTGGMRILDDGIWYKYTVDLGAYSGLGYVAIHHFDCYEQWLLCVDDITIVGGYTGLCSGIYNYGESCTVTATANEGYTFVNWTKDDIEVSTEATYNFTVTEAIALVANFSMNSYEVTAAPVPVEGGTVTVDGSCNMDEYFYDFEDGTLQGWTLLQGPNGDSPNNWMHCVNYNGNDLSAGYGHNASNGFMLSESFVFATIDDGGTPVHPDNYLVSPQIQLGGSISFWATVVDNLYGAEHFAVAVSTDGNSSVSDFTTVQEWIMSAKRTGGTRILDDGIWYEYTVDLGAYSGLGYVAIHHFDCYEQWLLCVDDITIVGGYTGLCSGLYGHGETCTVVATANEGYAFVNWTEDGEEVFNESTYVFAVTSDRNLVANFVVSQVGQTVELSSGWSWWSTNLDISLEDLKNVIADAVGSNGTATIKTQGGAITLQNGQWRGNGIQTLDIKRMYEIQTSVACEITLTGTPVNPSEYEITITPGNNWIGFLPGTEMTLDEAFGTFPVNGDVISSKGNSSVYRNGQWRGQLSGLQPGHGYIYQSQATGNRTFTFPTGAK